MSTPRNQTSPTGRYAALIEAALFPADLDALASKAGIPRSQVHVYVKRAVRAGWLTETVDRGRWTSRAAVPIGGAGDPTPAAPAKVRRGGGTKTKGSEGRTRAAKTTRKRKATPRASKVKPSGLAGIGPTLPNGTYCKLIKAASEWAKGHAIADAAKLPRPSTLVFLARAVERGWLEMREKDDTPDYRSTKRGRERAEIARQLGG